MSGDRCERCDRQRGEVRICGCCYLQVCVQPDPNLCVDEGEGAPYCAGAPSLHSPFVCVPCARSLDEQRPGEL